VFLLFFKFKVFSLVKTMQHMKINFLLINKVALLISLAVSGVLVSSIAISAKAADFNINGTLGCNRALGIDCGDFQGDFTGIFSVLNDVSFPPGLPGSGGPITTPISSWDIKVNRDGNFFNEIKGNQPSPSNIDIGIIGEQIYLFSTGNYSSPNSLSLYFSNPIGNRPSPQIPPLGAFLGGRYFYNSQDFASVISASITSAAPVLVPEPFTIIGTLIGGTAAFRIRKKLKAAIDN
jgi:hypothetical protein